MTTMFSEFSLKNLSFKREKMSRLARSEAMWGLFFLSPWILGFLFLTLLPMSASLFFSFTDYNLLHPEATEWIGIGNYVHFFTQDPIVQQSALVSIRFAIIAIPIGIAQPILMAAMLNHSGLRGRRFFTTMFYLPYIVPLVSAVYIWQGMMNDRTGWINMVLEMIGINGPDWFNDIRWIYPALVIIGMWGVGDMLLFTLASMQGIPTELYEAARVDGAGGIEAFLNITLPMITPVIFYNLVLSFIGMFQYFVIPFVLTGGTGRPGDSTRFYAMQLYKEAFGYRKMGYAATMAWVLFVFVMIVTIVLFVTGKYWVYYAAEEGK
ncbi:MAG: sugar ABC transporter permease [Chloroflexi bacterium]|nr:sugar ABC transporter permease [Chloroflexota bacterium]